MLKIVIGLLVGLIANTSFGGFQFRFDRPNENIAIGSSESIGILAAWDGTGSSSWTTANVDLLLTGPGTITFTSNNSQNVTISGLVGAFAQQGVFQTVGTTTVQITGGPGTQSSILSGNFATFVAPATLLSGAFGNSTIIAVPEPTSLMLVGVVGLGLVSVRRRKVL